MRKPARHKKHVNKEVKIICKYCESDLSHFPFFFSAY